MKVLGKNKHNLEWTAILDLTVLTDRENIDAATNSSPGTTASVAGNDICLINNYILSPIHSPLYKN